MVSVVKPEPFVPGAVAGLKAETCGDLGGFVMGAPVEPTHEGSALARTARPVVDRSIQDIFYCNAFLVLIYL